MHELLTPEQIAEIRDKAHDAIELGHLRAENERLAREVVTTADDLHRMADRADQAEVEVARLRRRIERALVDLREGSAGYNPHHAAALLKLTLVSGGAR